MTALDALSGTIASWFGFVGSCVISPVAACRPFLAFLALALAATVCLLPIAVALRALFRGGAPRVERVHRRSPAHPARVEPVLAPTAHTPAGERERLRIAT